MTPRPLSVTIIGAVFVATGTIGLIYHLSEFQTLHPFPYGLLGISSVRLLAIVAGAYMLLGRDWARWLALAWMGFHVVVGALHDLFQFAMHALFFVVLAYFLLRPNVTRYFRKERGAAAGRS